MKILKKPEQMQEIALKLKMQGRSIGLVPTMGALHDGHVSLINKARKDNDAVVVSIFVNPTQFGPKEDYLRYPRPFDKDKNICKKAGVDYIFAPEVKDMYPGRHLTYVSVNLMSEVMCGVSRPEHFKGVATVVAKLFNIVMPQSAYFGAKDYQQLKIVEKMVADLNFQVNIIPCPIIRELDGLAKSSRNQYLKDAERQKTSIIFQSLKLGEKLIKSDKIKNAHELKEKIIANIRMISDARIDYIRIVDPDTLECVSTINLPVVIALAIWVGKTRLIDNLTVSRK